MAAIVPPHERRVDADNGICVCIWYPLVMRWPFLASFCAISVVIIGVRYMGDSPEEQRVSFAENYPTKDSCLDGAAERITNCSSPTCYNGVRLFTTRCLEQASGDKPAFCEQLSVFYNSRGEDIFETHCEPHFSYRAECEKIIGYAGQYCGTIL